jgi:hypothetical protein
MLKHAKKILIILGSLSAIFIVAHFVFAADLGTSYGAATGLSNTDPRMMIANIIRIALGLLGIIAIGLIIYGGFLWMTAAGNEEQIDRAKKVLTSAVIGLVIILSAFAIATFVINNLLQATNDNNVIPGGGGPGSVLPPGDGGSGQPCGGGVFGNCSAGFCNPGFVCNIGSCLCAAPGGTGSSCNGSANPAVCSDNGSCDSSNYCDSALSCTCQPLVANGGSCDGDAAAPGCQAQNVCQPNSACSLSTCTCEAAADVGTLCSDSTTACQPDNNLCPNNQTCDPTAATPCSCQKLPVITAISPVGGFCANNHSQVCKADADCLNSTCDKITPNAAKENIITISGKYFGTTPGTVSFWDGSGYNIVGIDPKNVNSNCTGSWTDNQIIIVLPNNNGLKDGAIKVTTSGGKFDVSDDANGPKINLIINSIVRPGLCSTTPQAKVGANVNYDGVNFSNGSANFGVYNSPVAGINSHFIANAGNTILPSLSSGQTSTFVHDTGSGQDSNYINMNVLPSVVSGGAFISSFSPATGNKGQYITIIGSGFGQKGSSQVYFGPKSDNLSGSFDFPSQCLDSIWSDQQIIVKVPTNIDSLNPNFNNYLTIALDNGTVLTTQNSTPRNFVFDSGAALSPSLCKIIPEVGQPGTPVNLLGENFGAMTGSSLVRFFFNKDVSGAANLFWDAATIPNSATAAIPLGATTGQVKIINGLASNGLNIMVGSCLEAPDKNTACGSQICCLSNTSKAGSCVDSVADCDATASSSVYQFSFSTGLGNSTPPPPSGSSCQENSLLSGTCLLGGTCPNVPGACSLFNGGGVTPSTCSCCCRKIPSNPDCCASLTCEGACGSDASGPNTNQYGSCGGCAKSGGDAACSCAGHSGQFCDTGDSNFPDGVCRDCSAITDKSSCSQHAACCVDHTRGDSCVNKIFGVKATDIFQLAPSGGINYCGYFQCGDGNTACQAAPVSNPVNTHFASSTECGAKCGVVPPTLGRSCSPLTPNGSCNTCGAPFSCLQSPSDNNSCGFCCCDPKQAGQCDILTKGKTGLTLSCVANVGPCDGAGRGLCCGCGSNNDCDAGNNPTTQGCGSDTCCRERPGVSAVTPVDSKIDVCRNSQITATFNQKMDGSSFNGGNFVLLEQVLGKCPLGAKAISPLSQLPVQDEKNKNIFALSFDKFIAAAQEKLPWIFGQPSLAFSPDPLYSYCSVPGSASAEQIGDTTKLIFTPSGVLDANATYFAVIRGAKNLNDNSVGVANLWGITMNNPASSAGQVSNSNAFSGVVFNSSYIWSFQTKKSNGEDGDGICAIASVSVFPDSYLINTDKNSLIENDNDHNAKTFDTVNDYDKVFLASALSDDGESLYPVAGYAWNWTWSFIGHNIATINPAPFANNTSSQLIQALPGVTNDNTTIKAKVNLTDQSASSIGGNASSTAALYVFLCTTTWPAMQGGTWHPWRDAAEGASCTGSGACTQANYLLYYCRDSGSNAKDLPPLTNPATTIGSTLTCSSDGSACPDNSIGKPCGVGGTCQDIVKESYFFKNQ